MKSNEWIPVSERLPETGALVVALCRYAFAPDSSCYDENGALWCPLPEIPEVKP